MGAAAQGTKIHDWIKGNEYRHWSDKSLKFLCFFTATS